MAPTIVSSNPPTKEPKAPIKFKGLCLVEFFQILRAELIGLAHRAQHRLGPVCVAKLTNTASLFSFWQELIFPHRRGSWLTTSQKRYKRCGFVIDLLRPLSFTIV